jgi:hypothetical protein
MIDTSAARHAVAARLSGRRRTSRLRRLRTVAAAGFAGAAVALAAGGQHAAKAPGAGPPPRFGTTPLVNGLVAVPVRFADPGSAAFLRPGDRIDVLAADDQGSAGPGPVPDAALPPSAPAAAGPGAADSRAAVDVTVLGVNAAAADGLVGSGASDGGGLVYLAVDNATAARLARAAARSRLSYALHAPRRA